MTDAAYEPVSGLDINDTDTVFRNPATGRLVKVRVVRVEGGGFGLAVFEVSGAACNAEGRALPWGEGHAIAPAQRLTIHTDRPVDVGAILEEKRLEVAAATLNALAMEEALRASPRCVAPGR